MDEQLGGTRGWLGLLTGVTLLAVACGSSPCANVEARITAVCGAAYDSAPFAAACTSANGEACSRCVDEALDTGSGACADLAATCDAACLCPSGRCDGGARDAGFVDASIGQFFCGRVGVSGGMCRGTTSCVSPLTCEAEVPSDATTHGDVFNAPIPSGSEDPERPGEFLAGAPSTVPVGFAPGGLCTEPCVPGAAESPCGLCSTCTTAIGPPGARPLLSTRAFTRNGGNASDFGVCRVGCTFEPEGRGSVCAAGYTCDPTTNLCVEACVSASQCNTRFGPSASAFPLGVVEYSLEPPPYTCSADTGRCEWAAQTAALGDPCDFDADCAEDVGLCYFGRCTTSQCNLEDADGALVYPCPTGSVCAPSGGRDAAICVSGCEGSSDCFDEQACVPVEDPAPGAPSGMCSPICGADSECGAGHRCRFGALGGDMAEFGTCARFCDHLPDDGVDVPGATVCEAEQRCVEVEGGLGWGRCVTPGGLCDGDESCHGAQACLFEGLTMLGRCVDGCDGDGACGGGERCVIANDADGYGVCRAPGGACARSGAFARGSMQPYQPRLGDGQCVPGQTCDAAIGEVGACVGELPDAGPLDAGPLDAGSVDAGPLDAG